MDISIVIPCYNEIANVKKIKEELIPVVEDLAKSNQIEVIFVDDGSTDGTMESIRKILGDLSGTGIMLKFINNNGNWGLGMALRNGFSVSTGDIIVTTDSDGTYKFNLIKDLLACLSPDVDIITASPYHKNGGVIGVPRYRLALSQGSSFIYRILVNRQIHTYTCLFRAYRRKIIDDVPFISNGFMAGTELLVKSMLKGYHVAEFPAILYKRTYGVSKAKITRTIFAHLRFQWSVFLHRIHIIRLVGSRNCLDRKPWLRTKYSIK
jgi:dolichol-phosphate mannosyltransferase